MEITIKRLHICTRKRNNKNKNKNKKKRMPLQRIEETASRPDHFHSPISVLLNSLCPMCSSHSLTHSDTERTPETPRRPGSKAHPSQSALLALPCVQNSDTDALFAALGFHSAAPSDQRQIIRSLSACCQTRLPLISLISSKTYSSNPQIHNDIFIFTCQIYLHSWHRCGRI